MTTPEPTVGDLMERAKAAAPGSIRVGDFIVTYQGEFNYAEDSRTAGAGDRKESDEYH